MSLDPIEGQRAKRRAESEAARDSDEIWTPIAAGATAGSGGGGGGGGTGTLGGGTTFLATNNTDVYDPGAAVLITTEIVTAGQYLLAGAMVIEPGGAGSITLRISINATEKVAAVRNAPATFLDSLGLPMFAVELAAEDEVTLIGDAYGGTPGDGAMRDSTYLTVIGPLDSITVS